MIDVKEGTSVSRGAACVLPCGCCAGATCCFCCGAERHPCRCLLLQGGTISGNTLDGSSLSGQHYSNTCGEHDWAGGALAFAAHAWRARPLCLTGAPPPPLASPLLSFCSQRQGQQLPCVQQPLQERKEQRLCCAHCRAQAGPQQHVHQQQVLRLQQEVREPALRPLQGQSGQQDQRLSAAGTSPHPARTLHR